MTKKTKNIKTKQNFTQKYQLHNSKAANYWLALLAFLESSIFPLPVDVIYIPLLLKNPHKAYKYAFIATLFSVLGSVLGWVIGAFAYKTIALPILNFYGKTEIIDHLRNVHSIKILILFLFSSGFIHIPPIKIVNIFAGLIHVNIVLFLSLNILARTIRLYGLAWLIKRYGESLLDKGKKIMKLTSQYLSHIKSTLSLVVFLSIIPVLSSYILQYWSGYIPCELCYLERHLFTATMVTLALVGLLTSLYIQKANIIKSNLALLIITILITLLNLGISIYHYGVENHYWTGPQSCRASLINKITSTKDLLKAVTHRVVVACDVPQGKILHISFTAWAIIFTIIELLAIIYLIYRFYIYLTKKD